MCAIGVLTVTARIKLVANRGLLSFQTAISSKRATSLGFTTE